MMKRIKVTYLNKEGKKLMVYASGSWAKVINAFKGVEVLELEQIER